MYHYSLHQWLLFFFIYCFFGWVWETCYVSAKQRHWVNRGFMKGPFLPIYGSGALAILIATLPVRTMPVLVYIFGLIGATALELVTGICMEKMFHVRYWDYSNQKFNFMGHICLTSSIAWGAFSLAMIYGFHKPVERLVLGIPAIWLDLLTTLLAVVIAADFAISFKTAMELRDILDNMERIKDEMKRLQRRAEIIEAFLADDIHDAAENFKEEFSEKAEELMSEARERKEELMSEARERKEDFLEEVQEHTDELRDSVKEYRESLKGEWNEKTEEAKAQLEEIREKQQLYLQKAKSAMPKNAAIANLLKRNPSATSRKYAHAFKEYRHRLVENIKKEMNEHIISKN